MPCRDYGFEDEYNSRREYNQRLDRLQNLVEYICKQTGFKFTGQVNSLDYLTRFLCSTIKSLTESQKDTILYNGRNRDARDLTDWWEDHQERDKEREVEEKEIKRKKELKKRALAKLTKAEREALNL